MGPSKRSQACNYKTQIIQHHTHPKHPLQQVNKSTEYLCNGCNTLGSGTRYNCSTCDFDLHDHCATCPNQLSSYLHPHHVLILKNKHVNDRICDVCGDLVNGLFYACEACQVDVHPLCTLLPLNAQHSLHPQHMLTLQPGNPGWCAVCRQVCNYWRYRCNTCCLDVHPECVLAPSDVPGGGLATQPSTTRQAFGVPYGASYPIAMQQGFQMGMINQPNNQLQTGLGMGMNQLPFYQGQGGLGMATNQPFYNQGQASNGNGTKRNIYSAVGRLALRMVTGSIIGVPIG